MTTAVRTWNKPRTKATLTVTFDDGRTKTTNGARAARAEAVIIVQFTADEAPHVYGLRGDLAAARHEAHRLTTQTERQMRSRFGAHGTRTITPHHHAEVVTVTDAEQETPS